MARVKLSKRYCDTATHEGKPGSLDVRWDESLRGFGLRVYPSGRKAWVIFYRTPEGRQRFHSLAPYEHLALDQARDEAKGALGRVAKDKADPAEERKAARHGDTVEDLVTLYVEEWAKPRKKTWAEDERQLKLDVVPTWGSRRMVDISRGDVRALLEGVVRRGSPVAANRLLAVLRTLFGFAVDRELVEHSPCERIRPPAKELRRERVLTADEIRTLWAGAQGDTGRALRLILATAQRPGEVAGAHWREIEGGWWTIPQERHKASRSHRVPLAALALDVLGKQGRGYVFPSPGKRKGAARHLTLYTLDHDVAALLPVLKLDHFTPHDLRRTAATLMAGQGVPRLVISRILGHAEGGTTSIYDRHSYDAEKRAALEAWERWLVALLNHTPSTVAP
jgi:integrase